MRPKTAKTRKLREITGSRMKPRKSRKSAEIAKSGRRDLAPDGAPARPRRGARLSMKPYVVLAGFVTVDNGFLPILEIGGSRGGPKWGPILAPPGPPPGARKSPNRKNREND